MVHQMNIHDVLMQMILRKPTIRKYGIFGFQRLQACKVRKMIFLAGYWKSADP